ncbi:MAG: low molecular weight protein-tyrosine-phosphatase [Vampirovibrionales bacterium]
MRVLFVCMGNICRSPLAEGVMRKKIEDAGLSHHIEVASAGTHFYHIGEAPDPRSCEVATRHGYCLDGQKAQQVKPEHFEHYDYICVMDQRNLRDIKAFLPEGQTLLPSHVSLFLEKFAPECSETEVPDPYYGEHDGFTHVLRLVEQGCDGLLNTIIPSRTH